MGIRPFGWVTESRYTPQSGSIEHILYGSWVPYPQVNHTFACHGVSGQPQHHGWNVLGIVAGAFTGHENRIAIGCHLEFNPI